MTGQRAAVQNVAVAKAVGREPLECWVWARHWLAVAPKDEALRRAAESEVRRDALQALPRPELALRPPGLTTAPGPAPGSALWA